MLPKVAVVAHPSQCNQPKSVCWKCGADALTLPMCATCGDCGALQDLPDSLDHFTILGVPRTLQIEDSMIRERFYELSKTLHPDRFVNSSASEQASSLRWTTALNRAHQCLRDRIARSRYLLEIHGVSPDKNPGQPPLDLAEAYFEHQELLESGGTDSMRLFETGLKHKLEDNERQWHEIALLWAGQEDKKSLLDGLKHNIVTHRFLTSMQSDLEKKFGKKR